MSEYGFVVDECVTMAVVNGLRAAGADVVDSRLYMQGWADADILAWAWRERRLVISHDYDHGDLVVRDNAPAHGIILFAPGLFTGVGAPDPYELARSIAGNARVYVNAVTIIGAKRIRRRLIKTRTQR